VATYATGYLRKHQIVPDGLMVAAWYHTGGRPTRITDIRIEITVPPQVPAARLAALMATAKHCTAHHTLQHIPYIEIVMAGEDTLALEAADTSSLG
jgi:hypothetical protein